jgi:hypothetical protein
MEELYAEGLATHGGPESCVDDPQGRGEALTGGHCQLEQSEGDFRRFASAIHQVACDV